MKLKPRDKRALLAAALGKTGCDLAVKNIRYVNLFTGEIYPATVFVHQGFVVHVETQQLDEGLERAAQVVDGGGRYLTPSLIDAHIHIESSMMTPRNFAAAVIPHGVLTVITDPHEIGNVYGEEAVRYMHDAGEDLPMHQFIDVPSCVPAVPGMEQAGATFDAGAVDRLAKLPNVIGLAEVMDFVGVVNGDERMMSMIDAAERNGLYLQGHLPHGAGRTLSAYLIGGPHTCHETTLPGEALAKLRAGMYVDARESSLSKNVATIWNDVKDLPWRDRLCLCTDDREADDIREVGQLDDVVRHLTRLGMDPLEALRACTLHAAQAAGLENLGAVAPGYTADFLLVDDLAELSIASVWFAGRKVAENGKLIVAIEPKHFEIETRNSVHVMPLTEQDFYMRAPVQDGEVKVNVLTYPNISTSATVCVTETLPVKNGTVDISGDDGLMYAMIVNRYGKANRSFGVVRGFGAVRGADGSTVSHDSHNLCIVFKDAASGFAVYQALAACGGGMSCAVNGKVVYTLPLPCGGLMSNDSCDEVADQGIAMKKALREELGLPQQNPLLRIATLALPVSPEVKFSDLGLVDVLSQKFIPIFPEN